MTYQTEEVAVVSGAAGGADAPRSYVDWPAIFAGAFVAWALAFVLMAFGSGLGLTLTGSPWQEGMSATWFFVAAALWFIWVQITSVMAGGYLAGRMRRRAGDANGHEIDVRDGVHGLVVWAVGTVIAAALALGIASTGIKAMSSLAGGAVSAGAEAAGSALEGEGPLSGVVARLFRAEDRPANGTGNTGGGAGGSAGARAPDTGGGDQTTARRDVLRVLVNAGLKGELSAEDKDYIARIIERETGMSAEAARQRVDQYLTQALSELRQAAEKARKSGIIVAFLVAATTLISALGAWWAAGVGGRHRDENVDLSRWFTIR